MTYLDFSISGSSSSGGDSDSSTNPPTRTLEESPFWLLDKRACVVCTAKPTCPACSSNEACSFTVQTCSECPQGICVSLTDSSSSASATPTASSSGGSHTNTGAVAGGVVAGLVVFFAIIGYLIWKYVYSSEARTKRLERQLAYDEELMKGAGEQLPNEKAQAALSPRYSKYSRASRMSSTTMSSSVSGGNVIPIAYIPGVFSRTADSASSDRAPSEQFFRASDIMRDSQYSDGAGIRSSIATTNYRGSVAFAGEPIVVAQGRPNLVTLTNNEKTRGGAAKNLTVDTSRAPSTYSQPSPAESTFIGAVQQVDTVSQRMQARSIRIGKTGVGLQSQLIAEESDEEDIPEVPKIPEGLTATEPAKKSAGNRASVALAKVLTLGTKSSVGHSKSAKSVKQSKSITAKSRKSLNGGSRNSTSSSSYGRAPVPHANRANSTSGQHQSGPLSRSTSKQSVSSSNNSNSSAFVTSPTGSTTSSQLLDLRASTFSGFDVQFDMDENRPAGAAPMVPPKGPSRTPSIASRLSRASRRNGAPSRAQSIRSNASNRDSLDYVSHLPMEAVLYARSQESLSATDNSHRSGSTSPFGDENSL